MATYNRFKEFKKQNATQESISSDILQPIVPDRTGNGMTKSADFSKKDKAGLGMSRFSDISFVTSQPANSTSLTQVPSILPPTFEKPTPGSTSCTGFGKSEAGKTIDGIALKTSTPIYTRFSAKSHESNKPTSREQQIGFVFSDPIVLNVSKESPIVVSGTQFIFSRPKSHCKVAVSTESASFLSTIMSPRQSDSAPQSDLSRKGISY